MTDGWGREAMQAPSIWLTIKSKDQVAKIRIASMPLREVTVWPSEPGEPKLDPALLRDLTSGQWLRLKAHPDYKVSEQFPLLVIDRADETAKIFRASSYIYSEIRKFAMDPEWGNPMGYDITIKRTEKPGTAYWEIKASPNKTDLMQSEVDKVKALDLTKLLPDAYPANVPQPDDFDANTTPEDLPWEKHLSPMNAQQEADMRAQAGQTQQQSDEKPSAAQTQAKKQDTVFEVDDEPVNLDDIPF